MFDVDDYKAKVKVRAIEWLRLTITEEDRNEDWAVVGDWVAQGLVKASNDYLPAEFDDATVVMLLSARPELLDYRQGDGDTVRAHVRGVFKHDVCETLHEEVLREIGPIFAGIGGSVPDEFKSLKGFGL
jgi:hypothetical protein